MTQINVFYRSTNYRKCKSLYISIGQEFERIDPQSINLDNVYNLYTLSRLNQIDRFHRPLAYRNINMPIGTFPRARDSNKCNSEHQYTY